MKFRAAYIEITNKCNLNCRTCYNQSGMQAVLKELSYQEISFILSKLVSSFNCERVIFSGGEPFLHSQIIPIVDLLDEYPNIEFGFVTNGTIINHQLIDKLSKSKNVSIQLSLDGSNEIVNSKTRGVGNFSKAVDFLKLMSKISAKTSLMMTVSNLNCEDVEEFYRFAINNNVRPQFSFIVKSGNASENWSEKELTAIEKMKIINKIERLNAIHRCSSSIPYCTSSCILANGSNEFSIGIQTDGTIIPCQYLYDSSKYGIGNILSDEYSVIKAEMNKIRRVAMLRENADFSCASCILDKKCHRGCMAHAEHLAKDPLGPDGLCEFRVLSAIESVLRSNK